MRTVSFLIPNLDRLCEYSVETCHLVGFDGVPFASTSHLEGNTLFVETEDRDSAKFVIPWNLDGAGTFALSTGTLKDREEPFILPLEIARGSLCRLRHYLAIWSQFGLTPPAELHDCIASSTEAFIRSATGQSNPEQCAIAAEQSATLTLAGIDMLIESFTAFRDDRGEKTEKKKVWVGYEVDGDVNEDAGASVAAVPIPWSNVEPNTDDFQWDVADQRFSICEERRLRVFSGPLMDVDSDSLPDWIYLWQNDIDSLEKLLCRYVQQVVNRYKSKVDIWNCGTLLNSGKILGLSEEFRLRLSVRAIEALRASDSGTPLLVTVDQPWGEYLLSESLELSPLQFADMLSRAEIGLSGFGLKFCIGETREDTLVRDCLEFGAIIDRWSTLGKPLVLIFDANTTKNVRAVARRTLFSFLRTKPAVQGICFSSRFRSAGGL